MQEIIVFPTGAKEGLYDITDKVKSIVEKSGVEEGIVTVYAHGATAAIMIQENWDDSVRTDMLNFLDKIIPQGVWLHDMQDNNGAAHLKSGLIGPSETIPVIGGKLGLSTWQNIFFCEFDGPRSERKVSVTVVSVNKSC